MFCFSSYRLYLLIFFTDWFAVYSTPILYTINIPQNGRSTASSMAYSFSQKCCFFTFVAPIDRRKKVLTADQIFSYLRVPIVPHEHVENTQFLAGARAFGGHLDFGSISEKKKLKPLKV